MHRHHLSSHYVNVMNVDRFGKNTLEVLDP
jgi:hypothetical protein